MDEPTDDDPERRPQAEFLWWQLRLAILKARRDAKFSQKKVATEMGWSISKVSRIEQGGVYVTASDVRAMFSLFGAKEPEIKKNVELVLKARNARSWSDFKDVLSAEYVNYIGKEQAASHALKYETGLVPGLLQTLDYSMALFGELGIGKEEARRRSEVRQLRQNILQGETGLELTIVIGEIVLARKVGGDEVMRAQIERLLELSDHDRISLFLMPFSAGAHPGLGTPFTILQFQEQEVQSALYLEDGLKQTTSVEAPGVVEDHLTVFNQIEEAAEKSGSFEKHVNRILKQYYS